VVRRYAESWINHFRSGLDAGQYLPGAGSGRVEKQRLRVLILKLNESNFSDYFDSVFKLF
jgi:hypothetical protein